MIAIRTQIERWGIFASREVTRRETDRIMKRLLNRLLAFWHKTFLAFHFTAQARSRYGAAIEKRTAAYMRRKARKKHHQNNLVWSGDMLADVMRPPHITGSSKRATIHLRWRTARTRDFSIRADREMSVIAQSEDDRMAREFDAWFKREVESVKASRRIEAGLARQGEIEAGIQRLQDWMAA